MRHGRSDFNSTIKFFAMFEEGITDTHLNLNKSESQVRDSANLYEPPAPESNLKFCFLLRQLESSAFRISTVGF